MPVYRGVLRRGSIALPTRQRESPGVSGSDAILKPFRGCVEFMVPKSISRVSKTIA